MTQIRQHVTFSKCTIFHFPGDSRRKTFLKAVELYKKSTCINLVEVPPNDSSGFLKVLDNNIACSSNVGFSYDDATIISLTTGCNDVSNVYIRNKYSFIINHHYLQLGIVIHEMGHAIGMTHTHSRPDRNTYVEIWKENVEEDYKDQFDIRKWFNSYDVPYDYLSIMHYPNSVRFTSKFKSQFEQNFSTNLSKFVSFI